MPELVEAAGQTRGVRLTDAEFRSMLASGRLRHADNPPEFAGATRPQRRAEKRRWQKAAKAARRQAGFTKFPPYVIWAPAAPPLRRDYRDIDDALIPSGRWKETLP